MFESMEFKTTEKNQMLEILEPVKAFVAKSGLLNGIVVVYIPHTTAGVTINKNYDPVVPTDILNKMSELVPKHGDYQHIEGNSDAHIKASLFGNSVTIILNNGRMELGMFQSLFLCEFDGPRKRRVLVKIIPG
ncbi:secondary thiamine-phosphate synthase enzyme YjbQ [Fusibacter paucivorans]|uniref:Secondary thiamine-phosphate synthase enzyme YjbQ n=1 Tax=Fusibacter paucivorans TaxID=76009 RepID=A0ABS5PUT8_9FIRM|nr:secondary thiamine-phosphate synthase enzyme YjbQ [Fusibacter paucivorans]MBS7528637.1 secondary thiamine-phosphate synthase enzyme YjbQ [Fusibacter paucivorans]